MIDQTLLYTASTRPSERLVLMGNKKVVEKAVATGSIAQSRKTYLKKRVRFSLTDIQK
jgi:exodeoxyribonuclease V alpha subunit